jgi:hypothetical protein
VTYIPVLFAKSLMRNFPIADNPCTKVKAMALQLF